MTTTVAFAFSLYHTHTSAPNKWHCRGVCGKLLNVNVCCCFFFFIHFHTFSSVSSPRLRFYLIIHSVWDGILGADRWCGSYSVEDSFLHLEKAFFPNPFRCCFKMICGIRNIIVSVSYYHYTLLMYSYRIQAILQDWHGQQLRLLGAVAVRVQGRREGERNWYNIFACSR